jgi:hypothetical protein
MDFNPGNITVSLNYTLQISHIMSSLHSKNLAIDFIASHTELNSQLTIAWVAPNVKKKHLSTDYAHNKASLLL